MNKNVILILLSVTFILAGVVMLFIFLASVAIYQSFYLVGGCILIIILYFVAVRIYNKYKE